MNQETPIAPTLQDLIEFAEREASIYKKELPLCRELIRLGDRLRENAEYIKSLLQVAISSFHNWHNNTKACRRVYHSTQKASLFSLDQKCKLKQHEVDIYKETLTTYEEAIQAGDLLNWW
jgi:hypothetical protein